MKKPLITFESYLYRQNRTLLPWEKEVSRALLAVMVKNKVAGSGKSFLLYKMLELGDVSGMAEVKLLPWQKTASDAFFVTARQLRVSSNDQTLLIGKILEFIDEYGNDFEVPE